jgi:hypothetical protein
MITPAGYGLIRGVVSTRLGLLRQTICLKGWWQGILKTEGMPIPSFISLEYHRKKSWYIQRAKQGD